MAEDLEKGRTTRRRSLNKPTSTEEPEDTGSKARKPAKSSRASTGEEDSVTSSKTAAESEKAEPKKKDGHPPTYPKYYKGCRAEDNTPSDKDESEDVVGNAKDSQQATEKNGRPKRKRSAPELFTDYRQGGSKTSNKSRRVEEENPYKDLIFWAKFSSHPFWPAMKLTPQQIEELETKDGVSLVKEQAKYGKSPITPVLFLGSNSKAVVRDADIVDYVENFGRLTRKRCGKQFEMGIEMADAVVLRKKNENAPLVCHECTKEVTEGIADPDELEDAEQPLETPKPDEGILCDRCLELVHVKCSNGKGTFLNGFGNLTAPVWFCQRCTEDAPLTLKYRKDQEDKALKKAQKALQRRKSTNAAADSQQKALTTPTTTAVVSTVSTSAKSSSKKKARSASTVVSEGGPSSSSAGSTLAGDSTRATTSYQVSRDLSDNYCFVCGDGGTLVICDFPGCQRSYHKYCLCGPDASPCNDESEDEDVPWTCPWHTCAVCGACENENVVTPPPLQLPSSSVSNQSSSRSSDGPNNGTPGPSGRSMSRPSSPIAAQSSSKAKRGLLPPPSLATIPLVVARKRGEDVRLESNMLSSPTSLGKNSFIRCLTCPTALCYRHREAIRPIFDGNETTVPESILRPDRRGYFKCEHCFGANMGKANHKGPSPRVTFARELHRGWSRIVNGHEHICQLFLVDIQEQDVPEQAKDLWQTIKKNGVTNMFEVKNKIWTLGYDRLSDFVEDIHRVAEITGAVLGPASPIIFETAQTLPLLVDVALRAISSTCATLETQLDVQSKAASQRPSLDVSKVFESGCLNPSVVSMGKGLTSAISLQAARTQLEWERLLSNPPPKPTSHSRRVPIPSTAGGTSSSSSASSLVSNGGFPHEESRGIAASLLIAANTAGDFDSALPPSKYTLHEMLEQQSTILRSALRNAAFLRDAVEKTIHRFDSGQEDPVDENVVTLGEMRLAAEYSLANRNLKARYAQLQTLLKLERQARQDAEAKAKALEKQIIDLTHQQERKR